ncbi:hypothetical protein [Leptospira fainei]|uniref:hypothetical protein n=1 Tax=Leptospira fainei TaxID=48782 RepID=UPI0002E30F97|nr:hypothetical protein [Leptospira fainei]
MKPLLLVLDDWEDRTEALPIWKEISNLVDVKFLKDSIETTQGGEGPSCRIFDGY